MFAKVFASLFTGSLRGQPHDILVFVNLLTFSDIAGYVDKSHRAVADEVGLSEIDVRAAILRLESPDPNSRTPEMEGARLERLDAHRDWGWRIVNYVKYRDLRNEEVRRTQNRDAQRRRRGGKMSAHVSIGQHKSSPSAHAEAEAEAEVEVKRTNADNGDGDGKGSGEINVTFWLKLEVGNHYNRKPDDHWSYAEESALVEVAKRSEAIREWDEIRGYCFGMEDRKFFPQSVLSILEKWTQTLDKSRASIPPNPTSKMKILQEQIDTHPANRESVYHSAKATQEQKDGLKKMMSDLTAAKRSMV